MTRSTPVTHALTMVNNVIGVVNYVIAANPSLLNFMIADIRDLNAGEPEREALTALFSGTLEFNNMFCSFKGEGTGAVRHMFSHHILKPERTPLEAHPWGTPASSGSFSTLYQSRLIRAHAYKTAPADQILSAQGVKRIASISLPTEATVVNYWPSAGLTPGLIYLRTGNSSHTDLPDESVDLIITDPPYMDNVHYSELADFFHAWLRALAPFPGYPSASLTTRSAGEVQSASPQEFEDSITNVLRECSRTLRPQGLIAFTFHQARLSGWISVMHALAEAGFLVTAIQPVKGEMTTSVTKSGVEPSNLDAIIVCRKRTGGWRSALADAECAAAEGEQRLIKLRSAGVEVGAADIRSVIRGHVLATYTATQETADINALAEQADHRATQAVARLA
jgi:putative DNA methylase